MFSSSVRSHVSPFKRGADFVISALLQTKTLETTPPSSRVVAKRWLPNLFPSETSSAEATANLNDTSWKANRLELESLLKQIGTQFDGVTETRLPSISLTGVDEDDAPSTSEVRNLLECCRESLKPRSFRETDLVYRQCKVCGGGFANTSGPKSSSSPEPVSHGSEMALIKRLDSVKSQERRKDDKDVK
jgi:hypothetical protein